LEVQVFHHKHENHHAEPFFVCVSSDEAVNLRALGAADAITSAQHHGLPVSYTEGQRYKTPRNIEGKDYEIKCQFRFRKKKTTEKLVGSF
jgi:hypothetical protein